MRKEERVKAKGIEGKGEKERVKENQKKGS